MNPSTLTAKEVLRMCSPETDLERRLFDLVSELQNELDSANNNIAGYESKMLYCIDTADAHAAIASAIGAIRSGKVDGGIGILERLIEDGNI